MKQRMERRDFLSLAFSGLAAFMAACSTPNEGEAHLIHGAEGRVLHWEKDNLIVLVSGAAEHYEPGQTIKVSITLNNQGLKPIRARVRTKLIGRGMQAVAEAPVQSVEVGAADAEVVEKALVLPSNLVPGDYSLLIEVPPWTELDAGHESVSGGGRMTLSLTVGTS